MYLDDWLLDMGTFRFLDCLWGPHTVDRFADNYNAHLTRFNSRYACPGTEAVDALLCAMVSSSRVGCKGD